MANLRAMERDLLAECEDDHVGLWVVIGYVEDEMPGVPESQIGQETLDLLHRLLAAGQIQSGVPDSNGRDFHPWPFSAEAIIDKINSLWKPNGPRPGPGELVWFTTPSNTSVGA